MTHTLNEQDEMALKLQNSPPKKLFLSYLIPSLFGMILMASNILIDGIFVSHGVGEDALAGVNIATPIFSILLAVSLWIGMGGATLYSIALGENKIKQAQKIFTQSVILTVSIVGLLIIIGFWKLKEIAYLFGASATTYPHVRDYLFVILAFGLVYVLENILSIYIRNDGNPKLAMVGLAVSAILNVILNYIFIFIMNWGVSGAAYATGIATVVGLLVLMLHFLQKSNHLKWNFSKVSFKQMGEILKIGLPSYVVEMSFALIVVAYNITFLRFAGDVGVTAFAVINYLHAVFLMIFIAVGSALQPIVSFHYGAQLYDRLKVFLRLAIITATIIGVGLLIVGYFSKSLILLLFGVEAGPVADFTKTGINYYFIGYVFLGFNLVIAEYFQAIKKIRLSTIIVLCRSIIIFMPLLFLLPYFGSATWIWLAFPIAEGLTTLGLVVLFFKSDKLKIHE